MSTNIIMADWYYGENGGQLGPVDDQTLQAMVAQGRITAQTLVWREGMSNWQPYSTLALTEFQSANLGPSSFSPSMYAPAPNSGLAIASMVCGIVSLILCYVNAVAAIPAIICGHMALKKINESELPMAGRGMAIAGLITGYLGLLFQLLVIGIVCFAIFSSNSTIFP